MIANQSTTLTATFRREAFAANANAAASSRAHKRSYVRRVVAVDLFIITIAVLVGYLARFQGSARARQCPTFRSGSG